MALVLTTALLMPFARMPVASIPGFFPIYQTAAVGTCVLTAFLLYSHFQATRDVALLHLGAGQLYVGAVLVMQLLAVKGLFLDDVRLLGGPQSTVWFWFCWHLGPAVGGLYLALGPSRSPAAPPLRRQAVRTTTFWLVLAVAATGLLVLGFHQVLPVLDVDGDYGRIVTSGVGPGVQLLLVGALVALWRASRFHNAMHLWYGTLLVALLCDNAFTMLAGHRSHFGWYAGRLEALAGFVGLAFVYLRAATASYFKTVADASELAASNSRLDLEFQESRRHADELVRADIRKDEFLVMLAHELRNPLAPMSAAARLLSLGSNDGELVRKTSEMLNRQVAQMSRLVEDLLDSARLSRGIAAMRYERVDCKKVLADALEQARPLMLEKSHDVEVSIASAPAVVMGDHGRLVQVMTNLLHNAAKYTGNGGRILLELEATPTQVCVTVADNGIGMSPGLLDRAFILFTQGEPLAQHSQGGLGVGLALVKQLVELHGGQVDAASAGTGLGAQLRVVLPIAP